MFYDGLVALMKRLGTKPSDPYDWETKEQVERVVSSIIIIRHDLLSS